MKQTALARGLMQSVYSLLAIGKDRRMRNRKSVIVAVVGILLAGLAVAGQVVRSEKNNVTASRLAGQWVPDKTLADRFPLAREALTFRLDASVAGKLPAKYDEFLAKKQIFLSGIMKRGEKEFPFVLISHAGNPYLLWFRERDGDPMGDSESNIVMLARASQEKHDILFIGGDFNNEAFRAFRRAHD